MPCQFTLYGACDSNSGWVPSPPLPSCNIGASPTCSSYSDQQTVNVYSSAPGRTGEWWCDAHFGGNLGGNWDCISVSGGSCGCDAPQGSNVTCGRCGSPPPVCTANCGSWSGCSASCGGGSQSRTCTRGDCSTYGQSQSCNEQCCPVDGGWGSWGDWSGCSVSCGGGEQSRSRPCNNPSPSCGGSYCSGAGTNSRSCNNQACPPTLNFSSSATNIFEGWDVVLSWATTWVTSCTATGGWSGSKAAGGGNETVIPPIPSATYNLQCSGPGGSIQRSVTINVAPLILPDWREIIPR